MNKQPIVALPDSVRERRDLIVRAEAENRAGKSIQALADQLRQIFPKDKLPSALADVKRDYTTGTAEITIEGIKFECHPATAGYRGFTFLAFYRELRRFLWWKWVNPRACWVFYGDITSAKVIDILRRHNRALEFEERNP